MTQPARSTCRRVLAPAMAAMMLAGMALGVAGTAGATAEDATVTGSAMGYMAEVSLFGGPASARGPEPVVELAPDAADSPLEASVDDPAAVFGPAVIFRAGHIDVGAEGTGGSVTSYARVQADLDEEAGDPRMRPGPMLYDALESTCTADEDGFTVTTTVTNGVVETSYDPATQLVATSEPVPENPEPGYAVEGTLDHIGDRYRIVYNEQTVNDDGTLTVNAAHMYLLGDIAVGDLIVGQSTCGTSATPAADVPVANTGTPPDAGEANGDAADDADEDAAPEDQASDEAGQDEAGQDEAGQDDNGVPVAMVGLGLGALVAVGIVVALVVGRRSKAPADGGDR